MPTLKPTGYSTLSPYLIVAGAEAVIEFLQAVFDAVPLRRHADPQGRIMHAEVRIDDTVVMIADATDQWPPAPAHLHVYVADVDATYRLALAAGGVSVAAPSQRDASTDTDRRGGVRDSGGNTWWMATQTR